MNVVEARAQARDMERAAAAQRAVAAQVMAPYPSAQVQSAATASDSATAGRRVANDDKGESGAISASAGGASGSEREESSLTAPSRSSSHKVKFFPFPGVLRWPTAPGFICVCCLSGLLHASLTILAFHDRASTFALGLAALAAAFALGVLLLLWVQLICFVRRHCRQMWVPEKSPQASCHLYGTSFSRPAIAYSKHDPSSTRPPSLATSRRLRKR